MKGFSRMGTGLPAEVQQLLRSRYETPPEDLGHCSALWFADSRGPKVVLLYNNFLWPNIHIHVAAREGALWCYPELLFHVFAYPFNQLNCSRVTAPIRATNKASIQCVKALGFQHEGTLRKAGRGGEDILVYGMLREECRWIPQLKEKAA